MYRRWTICVIGVKEAMMLNSPLDEFERGFFLMSLLSEFHGFKFS